MQQDGRTERTEWCWVYGTRDIEKETGMQQDRGQRGQKVLGLWNN